MYDKIESFQGIYYEKVVYYLPKIFAWYFIFQPVFYEVFPEWAFYLYGVFYIAVLRNLYTVWRYTDKGIVRTLYEAYALDITALV